MACSSKISEKELYARLPRKRMVDVKQLRVIDIRSIGDRKVDKWNGSTATDRIEADFKLYKGVIDFIFSLVKEEGEEEEAACSKVSIRLLAYMIRSKFDDDDFLSSKYYISLFHIIYIGFVGSYLTQDGSSIRLTM